MKLLKAINEQVPTYSEEELLLMENGILRDELEFQENMRSLELMETVLNCIDQEGEVSKSVEIMFGDSVEDKASFKEELEAAYENLISNIFDKKHEFSKLERLFDTVAARANQLLQYIRDNESKIKFPVPVKYTWKLEDFFVARRKFKAIVEHLHTRKWNKDYKDVRISEFRELKSEVEQYIKERDTGDYTAHESEFTRSDIDNIVKASQNAHNECKSVIKFFKSTSDVFEKHVKKSDEPKDEGKVLIAQFNKVMMFTMRMDVHRTLAFINTAFKAVKSSVDNN